MILVADTGPLIGLAKIQRIQLLESLTGTVLIPPAVRREFLGHRGPEVSLLEEAVDELLHVEPPGDPSREVEEATTSLDAGERAAIVLAKADEPDAVLVMDDQAGRQVARQLDLPVTGLIGVLLRLKEMEEIDEVTPHLETVRERGYWLSDEIIATARRMAGEASEADS
jgi:hypothetical protein